MRGLALILVVAVLGILAVLGSAFAVLSRLERRASAQRVHATRAYLLARSGLEHAAAAIEAGQNADYGGEDYNDNGLLDGVEVSAQASRPAVLDRESCPARHALRPSLYVRDRLSVSTPRDPALATLSGMPRGYSGCFGGERASWSLRVYPGGIHVNGGDPAAAPNLGYNAVLRRILGSLAESLDRDNGGADDASPVNLTDGQALIDRRPLTSRGWESYEQIRDLALGGSRDKLDALRPYLVLRAQTDRKVIAATATNALYANAECWSYIKMGSSISGFTRSVPPFESIGGKVVGRAPVDLDWARRRRPVLVALMDSLRGFYLRERDARIDDGAGTGERIGFFYPPPAFSVSWTGADDCRATADRFLQSTSELATWGQFNDFCDTLMLTTPSLPASDIPTTRQAKRDMLKANFNPNSDLNKFNPDPSMVRLVDKEDFWVNPSGGDYRYSTEFNLTPRCGGRVNSVGRVLDAQGRVLASRELSTEVSPHRFFRLTSQSELVAGDLGDPDVAGDESGWRAYGSAPYIQPALDGETAFAHRQVPVGGVSLQTGPEPHTVWSGSATGRPAAYDGQLRLATVETADDEFGPDMTFLARWTSGLDSDDVGNGPQTCITDTWAPPATNSVLQASNPGNLYPDGLYVEWRKVPAFRAEGNMAPTRGTLSFWVKPNFDASKYVAGTYVRRRLLFNNTRHRTPTPPSPISGPDTAMFYLAFLGAGDFQNQSTAFNGKPLCGLFGHERSLLDAGGADEIFLETPPCEVPHRWTLWNAYWNADPAVDVSLGAALRLDRGGVQGSGITFYDPPTMQQGVPPAFEFTQPDGYQAAADPSVLPPAYFHLGNRGKSWLYYRTFDLVMYSAPDSTFDEVAIYDFGADASDAFARFPAFCQQRFEAGRFYKGSAYPERNGLSVVPAQGVRDAGEWFSAPIQLARDGMILKRLAWTQIVPRGLRSPGGPAREDGDPDPEGRIVMELAREGVQVPAPAGEAYPVDAHGKPLDTLFTDSRGERIDRSFQGRFRLHAVFQPHLSDPLETAILDPLVLDDVTLTYWPANQPRLAAWGEGE